MSVQDDPFAAAPTNDDPFADPPPADPAAEVAAQPVEQPAADLPVVNREGEPVEANGTFDPVTQSVASDPAPAPQEAPQEEPPAPVAPAPPPPVVPDQPTPAPQDPPNETTEVPETTVEDMGGEPQEATQPASVTEAEAEVAPTPVPDPQPAPAAPEQSETPAGNGDGPSGLGKSPVRHYKVLYQTAAKTWTECDLQAAKDANTSASRNIINVKEDEKDKTGELWLAARNNDHAVRLSWIILGTPSQGVTAMPIPKGAWKPKRIAPAPPQPERERLVIS